MYSNPVKATEIVFDADSDADERTIAWLKRDLERRQAEREGSKGELVSSK